MERNSLPEDSTDDLVPRQITTSRPTEKADASGPSVEDFLDPTAELFGSGSTLLDCVLGGGWAKRRIINIVGDRSTGKTGLATEMTACYHLKYPKDKIRYAEAEAAFDKGYAEVLGMPLSAISFNDDTMILTVEQFHTDLKKFCDLCLKEKVGGLYILDSLDAVGSDAERERDFEEKSTYGTEKARKMSELFRRITQEMSRAGVTLCIISQVRENIGVSFGKSTTRSGGRALDFYASQVIEIANLGYILKERGEEGSKEKRAVGKNLKIRCEKNKVAMPFRECELQLYFAFGIEDVVSNLTWLKKHIDEIPGFGKVAGLLNTVSRMPDEKYHALRKALKPITRETWIEIEKQFLPKRRKYESESCG